MFIQVDFKDGTKAYADVSSSHTIQIISPDNHVQAAWGLDGIADLSYDANQPAPAATQETAGSDPQPAADSSSVSSEPQPTSSTGSDTAAGDPAAADAAAHDQAVADAQQAVAAVEAGSTDHVAAALADVEEALVEWPDSQPLLDAKAQLEASSSAS